ncbi:MAG: sulfatase-like hydrolase/transferase [Myxococcales bacterium]|nr:sulfatase-like hydrolase/transferase [Myxococcales bacterium]
MNDRTRVSLVFARAALAAASVLGVADASFTLGRSAAPPSESALFLVATVALLVVALVPTFALVAPLGASWLALATRARTVIGSFVGAASGAALGLAAFSGSAMKRSSLRPALIGAAVVIASAIVALLARVAPALIERTSKRRTTVAAVLALAAAGIGYAHATMLVRLYPALHAIAALVAASAAVAAAALAMKSDTTRKTAALVLGALLVSVGISGGLLRSQRARARARQHAPFAAYVVRAASRLMPRDPVRVVVDDDRIARGPRLDLEGLDIVLVTVDALRWDRLGAYGHRGGLTPAIDAIAQHGVIVERAYCTTPHTSYSLASLMTGKFFRGVSALGAPSTPHVTIASELRAAGYATAAFFPTAVFAVDADRLGDLRARGFGFEHRVESYEPADRRVREALSWLEAQPREKRAFVWVHLFEPHESYEAHPGARVPGGPSALSRYDAEVAAVDDAVRTLVEGYARSGRRAAFFVTADHGEEFGEHGGRFHGTTVYDEQIRVPFVFSVPGLSARRVRGPISHVDLLPTLLAGVGRPRPPRLRGRDFGPLAHGGPPARYVFASVGAERMVFDGRNKLLCDVAEQTCELFDVESDALERNNLADARPDVLSRLRPLIAGWDASHALFEREGTAIDAQSTDELPPSVERAIQGDRAAAPDAAAAIERLDAPRALRAVRALASLGVRDRSIRDALARATTRNARDLSLEAGVALTRLGDRRGIGAARDALVATDVALRRSAALGLATVGERDGVEVLGAWVNDRAATDSDRDAVVLALRALRDPRSFSSWNALLEDPRLAPEAARALGELGDARAIVPLEELARSTPYALTRTASTLALATLRAPSAREIFREALAKEPPLTDPFAILRALVRAEAPQPTSTQPSAPAPYAYSLETTTLGARRTTIALDRAPPRGPVLVWIEGRADAPCTARVAGSDLELGPTLRAMRVSLSGASRTLRIERCPGATITGAIVVAQLPSARGDQ